MNTTPNIDNQDIKYVSVNEACRLLGGLNRSTIHRWITAGKIDAYKLGGRTLLDIQNVYKKLRANRIMK